MINKKIIYSFAAISVILYSSLVFGVNYHKLDLEADSINNRIWDKIDTPIKMIHEILDFLGDEDEKFVSEYAHSKEDFKIEDNKDGKYSKAFQVYADFAESCLKIYENHAEILPEVQVETVMLFKRVTKKFSEHKQFLSEIEKIKSSN